MNGSLKKGSGIWTKDLTIDRDTVYASEAYTKHNMATKQLFLKPLSLVRQCLQDGTGIGMGLYGGKQIER
jgi:hypothetical protein